MGRKKKWMRVVLIVFAIALVGAFALPFVKAEVSVMRIDTENGRIKHEQSYFYGIYKTTEVSDTGFTEWVEEYGLETEPHWVGAIYNEHGLFGSYFMCAFTGKGHLVNTYRNVKEYLTLAYIDDPTTVVLEMRRLARIDDGRQATELMYKIMSDGLDGYAGYCEQ